MPSDVQFFLPNPNDHTTHFDKAYELYATTSGTMAVTLYTADTDHALCMKVSSPNNGQGVYTDVSNLPSSARFAVEMAYVCSTTQKILAQAYDQVNGATIFAASLAASVWSNFYKQASTPVGCSTVRLRLLRNSATAGTPFYIDDVKLHANALLADPDTYNKTYPDTHRDHRNIDGTVTRDRTGRHVNFRMQFPHLDDTAFQRLLDIAKSPHTTYFDDGNVPQMVESGTLRTATDYDYVGVTTGGTHNAYQTATTATPVTAAMMQATEYTNAMYGAVDGDDSNYATLPVTGTGKYGYHKFNFSATAYATSANVRKISITYKGLAQDESGNNIDGIELYAWDGQNWAMLDRSRTPDKQTLSFSTSKPEVAQQFVVSSLVRLLAKTRATKDASGSLSLRTHYVECVVNEDLDTGLSLLNKAALNSSGDVVSVKNLTKGITLQHLTEYRIGSDRQSVSLVYADSIDYAATYYAEVANNTIHDIATEDVGISMWVKVAIGASNGILAAKRAGTWNGYLSSIVTGKARLSISDGTDVYYIEGNTDLRDAMWHHVVMIIDRDAEANCRIYVDGSEDGTTNKVGTLADVDSITNAGKLTFGADPGGSSNVNGAIRDIVLAYPADITAANEMGASGEVANLKAHPMDKAWYCNYEDYWPSDDGSGTTVTGDTNDLTLSNAAGWAKAFEDGDAIEVEYDQYYNVVLDTLSEQPFAGDSASQPETAVTVHLHTMTPIEKT